MNDERRRDENGLTPVAELCRTYKVTARSSHYWIKQQHVRPLWSSQSNGDIDTDITGGSGHRALLSFPEAQIFIRIAQLTKAGVGLKLAARIARSTVLRSVDEVEVDWGIAITFEDDDAARWAAE